MSEGDETVTGLPEIAVVLGVSPATVRKHAAAIAAADPLAIRRHLLTGRWEGDRARLLAWLETKR